MLLVSWRLYWMTSWWRHQMETFSALLAIYAGNSPVPGEFPTQRPVTRSFDVFFDLRLNKRLSKQSWGWWFATLTCPLWRHRNVTPTFLDCSLLLLYNAMHPFRKRIPEMLVISKSAWSLLMIWCLLDATASAATMRTFRRWSVSKLLQ